MKMSGGRSGVGVCAGVLRVLVDDKKVKKS
jgi:hypothetical protein